jgi:hypothetical protein
MDAGADGRSYPLFPIDKEGAGAVGEDVTGETQSDGCFFVVGSQLVLFYKLLWPDTVG